MKGLEDVGEHCVESELLKCSPFVLEFLATVLSVSFFLTKQEVKLSNLLSRSCRFSVTLDMSGVFLCIV